MRRHLAGLAEIAEALGEGSIAADVRQLVARINEGRFFVACVGQFKRGKSTLLDALVGEADIADRRGAGHYRTHCAAIWRTKGLPVF